MLPNRFKTTAEVFDAHPDADGVYEAVGVAFSDELAKQRWFRVRNDLITTVKEELDPYVLFVELLNGDKGYFHTDGIVFKSSFVRKLGYFDSSLLLAQDTQYFLRAAALGKLLPGSIQNSVAIRFVHDNNRSNQDIKKMKYWSYRMYSSLFDELYRLDIQPNKKYVLFGKYFMSWKYQDKNKSLSQLNFIFYLLINYPYLIFKSFFWNRITHHLINKIKSHLK